MVTAIFLEVRCLQVHWEFSQSGETLLTVDKLLSTIFTKNGTIETNPKVSPKASLVSLQLSNPDIMVTKMVDTLGYLRNNILETVNQLVMYLLQFFKLSRSIEDGYDYQVHLINNFI